MGMTLTEKILAIASTKEQVQAGEYMRVLPDFNMTNDATTHLTIHTFEQRLSARRLLHPERSVFVIDHNSPADSVKTADLHQLMRQFAKKHDIRNFHDGEGICHQLMLEQYALPGHVIIGADSHTCTYGVLGAFATGVGSTDLAVLWATGETWLRVPETIKIVLNGTLPQKTSSKDIMLQILGKLGTDGATYYALEFSGSYIDRTILEARATLCNMAIEAGAKNAVIAPDAKVQEYLREHRSAFSPGMSQTLVSDPDARYAKTLQVDVSALEPLVACPHTMDNIQSLGSLGPIPVNEVFIGSCTNGRIDDLRAAAAVLKGNRVHQGVRVLVSPASRQVYLEALQEGLLEIFLESGAMVMNPNCSSCWGACQGVLGKGERIASTGNRNFRGRVGSGEAEIYIVSPQTAARVAVAGSIGPEALSV